MKLEWKDPPPLKNVRGGALTQAKQELDRRPGQWAILRKYPKNPQSANPTATRMRKRWPGYEFAARADGNGGSVLYGRKVKK